MSAVLGWVIGLALAAAFWVVVWLVSEVVCWRFPDRDPEGVLVATGCGLAVPVAVAALFGMGVL